MGSIELTELCSEFDIISKYINISLKKQNSLMFGTIYWCQLLITIIKIIGLQSHNFLIDINEKNYFCIYLIWDYMWVKVMPNINKYDVLYMVFGLFIQFVVLQVTAVLFFISYISVDVDYKALHVIHGYANNANDKNIIF